MAFYDWCYKIFKIEVNIFTILSHLYIFLQRQNITTTFLKTKRIQHFLTDSPLIFPTDEKNVTYRVSLLFCFFDGAPVFYWDVVITFAVRCVGGLGKVQELISLRPSEPYLIQSL